jgi:anti-sigma B factor antagonist
MPVAANVRAGGFPGALILVQAVQETLAQCECKRYPFRAWAGALCRPKKDPMQLRISTRTLNGILIVDCSGRVVFGEESAILRDTVRKLIAESSRIVLNLGGVTYIDSGGLGTLVSLYTTARNAGGTVKLANLTQRVGDLLQVTKLLTIFEVFESEEQAAQSFRKSTAA